MNTELTVLLIACAVIILLAIVFSDYDPPPKI